MKAHRLADALRVLNILDTLLTLFNVKYLGAVELNPLMARVIEAHWVLFVFVKIIGVGLCAEALAVRDAKKTLWAACACYCLAMATHAATIVAALQASH